MTLLLLLAACGRPVEAPSHPADFPHPDHYTDLGHGPDALAPDAACGSCHGEAGPGETCVSCHPLYPHPSGYVGGEVHGPDALELGTDCEACHGEGDRAPADVTGAACTHCHATWPHPAGYDEADAHGADVLARGTDEACLGCHPPGSEGDCASCHAYPHPADHLETHGAAFSDGETECGACHDAGRAGPTCEGCHADVPHPEGWATSGHLPAVQARGEATCRSCHPDGELSGPSLPVGCGGSCHGEAR